MSDPRSAELSNHKQIISYPKPFSKHPMFDNDDATWYEQYWNIYTSMEKIVEDMTKDPITFHSGAIQSLENFLFTPYKNSEAEQQLFIQAVNQIAQKEELTFSEMMVVVFRNLFLAKTISDPLIVAAENYLTIISKLDRNAWLSHSVFIKSFAFDMLKKIEEMKQNSHAENNLLQQVVYEGTLKKAPHNIWPRFFTFTINSNKAIEEEFKTNKFEWIDRGHPILNYCRANEESNRFKITEKYLTRPNQLYPLLAKQNVPMALYWMGLIQLKKYNTNGLEHGLEIAKQYFQQTMAQAKIWGSYGYLDFEKEATAYGTAKLLEVETRELAKQGQFDLVLENCRKLLQLEKNHPYVTSLQEAIDGNAAQLSKILDVYLVNQNPTDIKFKILADWARKRESEAKQLSPTEELLIGYYHFVLGRVQDSKGNFIDEVQQTMAYEHFARLNSDYSYIGNYAKFFICGLISTDKTLYDSNFERLEWAEFPPALHFLARINPAEPEEAYKKLKLAADYEYAPVLMELAEKAVEAKDYKGACDYYVRAIAQGSDQAMETLEHVVKSLSPNSASQSKIGFWAEEKEKKDSEIAMQFNPATRSFSV